MSVDGDAAAAVAEVAAIEARTAALADRITALAGEVDRSGRFPREWVDEARAAGLLGLAVPRALGGAGAGLRACCRILDRLAQGDPGTALGLAMHVMVVGSAARRHQGWPLPLYEQMARSAAAGEAIVNNCASEDRQGSPARGGLPSTAAAPHDEGYVLRGRKTWSTWLPVLTDAVVSARLETEDGPRVAQLLVRLGADGVRREPEESPTLLRSAANGTLVLDGVVVPRFALVLTRRPEEPDARGAVLQHWFRLCTTAVYVGCAAAARDAVAGYARDRRPNDRADPIAAIPAVQVRLGAVDSAVRAARLLVDTAAALVDAAEDSADPEAAMDRIDAEVASAKVHATGLAWRACEDALRLAGGPALHGADLPLERLARDVRGGLLHPPTEDMHHLALGRALASDTAR